MFPVTRKRFTAWVVFQGSDHRRFWRIFTAKGWRHCFVILPVYYPEAGLSADRYSQVIDPRTNYVASDTVFHSPDDLIAEALKNGATVVIKFNVDTADLPIYVPRGFLTCVSLVKSLLGISAFFVLTPKHLAKWLLRNGGEIVKG